MGGLPSQQCLCASGAPEKAHVPRASASTGECVDEPYTEWVPVGVQELLLLRLRALDVACRQGAHAELLAYDCPYPLLERDQPVLVRIELAGKVFDLFGRGLFAELEGKQRLDFALLDQAAAVQVHCVKVLLVEPVLRIADDDLLAVGAHLQRKADSLALAGLRGRHRRGRVHALQGIRGDRGGCSARGSRCCSEDPRDELRVVDLAVPVAVGRCKQLGNVLRRYSNL
mmetsp:Transcript_118660/g.383160  ORF Transcript_118660/g.383160 Transcript_118660/m.383160 type:complete len:228 (-) Transcript_118660:112-795(-)